MYEELNLHYKENKVQRLCKKLHSERDRQRQLVLADLINQTQIEIECILYQLKEH